jgi:hypothetical protein
MSHPLDPDLTVIQRIDLARMSHIRHTGRIPTRLVLTRSDFFELCDILDAEINQRWWINFPHTNEPEIFGMRFRVDPFAVSLSVLFQES